MAEKKWIGRTANRAGGRERVTGLQRFIADMHLESVLQVKLVTLNCGHARIRSIDTSAARRVEGVRAILTAADLPQPMPRFGPTLNDRPVIALGETKFYGEPVAAVAADDEDIAETAAALIHVDYEELPGVYLVEQALATDALLVQDPNLRPKSPFKQTNIMDELHFAWGDVEQAPAECVIENSYDFPMVTHFAIEPHAFMAAPDEEGVIIYSSIQHSYVLQRIVANVLGLPVSKVRVIAPDPGGGFGGKGYPKFEPLLAFLALKTGRPVRLVLTLEETFQAVRRASCRVHVRSGFGHDGRITFQDLEANFLIGAYADIAGRVVGKASYVASGPYKVPNVRITGRGLFSHTTPSTAFRGFGIPQISWAIESQLNEAANRLGIDRLEIRLRNLPQKGETFIPGDIPADGDWAEVLHKAAEAVGWGQPLGKHCGRGISMGLKNSASASVSFAIVRLHHDCSLTILSGTSDMGQGARTVFSQLAADELALPMEKISIVMGDTASVPFDASTSASRSTVFMGNAIVRACQQIKEQLKTLAAEAYTVPEASIQVDPGVVRLPEREVSYEDLLKAYFGPSRGEVIAVGTARGKYIPSHPLGGKAAFWEVVSVACEVQVDEETGEVTVTRLATVGDVGKALNPLHVEVQDDGGAVMGLGHTLMEHLIMDGQGRVLNLGALDYRIPTIQDIPDDMRSISIENEDGPGPYGAKGVGESGILAVSPAVGSAVNEAIGVVIRDLPLTPERVWMALAEKSRMA